MTEEATTMEEITCENFGCSHACFYNGENLPECACPKDLTLSSDDLNCEEAQNNNSGALGNSFLSADHTWRPIIANTTMCIKKRFMGFFAGQQIFLEQALKKCFKFMMFFSYTFLGSYCLSFI